jgi:cytochrome c oxidase subunit III
MRQPVKLGMALLFAGESVFFLMLILAFVVFRDRSLAVAKETLNFSLTSIYTVSLFGSSINTWRASRLVEDQDMEKARSSSRFKKELTAAIVLGGIFILGQGNECLRLLRHGVTISQNLFGTTFFTLMGMHGLHALIGIALLAGALWTVRPGTRPPRPSGSGLLNATQPASTFHAIAAFWYFVAAIWAIVFSVVYLWTFL